MQQSWAKPSPGRPGCSTIISIVSPLFHAHLPLTCCVVFKAPIQEAISPVNDTLEPQPDYKLPQRPSVSPAAVSSAEPHRGTESSFLCHQPSSVGIPIRVLWVPSPVASLSPLAPTSTVNSAVVCPIPKSRSALNLVLRHSRTPLRSASRCPPWPDRLAARRSLSLSRGSDRHSVSDPNRPPNLPKA
jgi:hypothetical protein